MKCLVLLVVGIAVVSSLPTDESEYRESRNIFTNFLGNIGILRVIPRECSTTSTFLAKGMCSLESACTEVGGAVAGACERAGVCCVVPAVCGSQVTVKRSWFVNKEFPGTIAESYSDECVLRVLKSEETIRQVRFDFQHLVLEDADEGICNSDFFRVTTEGVDGEEDIVPVLCGTNSGQHVYINMPTGKLGEIKVRVKVGASRARKLLHRSWRVYITQLDDTEMAPTGCLQYYDSKSANVRSLNYDSSDSTYVTNSDYDICFKKVEEFTSEADEDIPETTAFNVCGRVFSNVNLEQSFAYGTDNLLIKRKKREAEKTKKVSKTKDAKQEEKDEKPVASNVVSQIQQVVSQLQGTRDSGLQNVVKDANKMKTKKDATNKESAKPDDKKPILRDDKPEKDMKDMSPSDDQKETLSSDDGKDTMKNELLDIKVESPPAEEAKTDEKLKVNAETEIDSEIDPKDKITWLVLSDGSVKDSSKVSDNELKASEPEKTEAEAPEILKSDTEKVTAALFDKVQNLIKTKNEEESIKLQSDEMVKLDASSSDEEKKVILKDVEPTSNDMDKPVIVERLVMEDEERNRVKYTKEEAEHKFLSRLGCDGSYLLANDRKICGTFLRNEVSDNKQIQLDDRLRNANRISVRTIQNPQTSLRFSMRTNISCRLITTTTSTTTTSTTTTTTTAATTVEPESTTKAQRRVNLIQYIMGWYRR